MLLLLERRFRFRQGQTVALYVALYTAGRFMFENMRSDFAHTIGGLRVNAWVSLGLCVLGFAWFAWLARHGRPYERANEPMTDDIPTA